MTVKTSALLVLMLSAALLGCEQAAAPAERFDVAVRGVYAGALADNAEQAVVGSVHHGVSFWRLHERERLYDWTHRQDLTTSLVAAAFSADGSRAVTADEHTLVLWDTNTGEALRFWRVQARILDIALSRDAGLALLGLADHTAVLFDIQRGGIVRTFQHSDRVTSVSASRNGPIAVTGSEDYSAVSWNLQTGAALARVDHQDEVQLVRISPDGELVLSMSQYDKALLWRSGTGEKLGEVPLGAERLRRGLRFTAAAFSHDNRYLVTGRVDRVVSLWRVDDMAEIKRWKIPKKKVWKPTGAAVLAVAFAGPGEIKALSSNGLAVTLRYAEAE